jgi:hypothetical protein
MTDIEGTTSNNSLQQMNSHKSTMPFYHYQNNKLDPIDPPISPENVEMSIMSPDCLNKEDNFLEEKDAIFDT